MRVLNRLLSIDGGGIRGVFAIEVLQRIEDLLRERYASVKPDMVLADYFNFVGGTSTGAIIAALVAWGEPVSTMRQLYEDHGEDIFRPFRGLKLLRSKYRSDLLERVLKDFLKEEDGSMCTLATERLRIYLMLVMRNASTGGVWPVTNNPEAKYNKRKPGELSNLDIPLWQLIRASTAAPTYFPTEIVTLHSQESGEQTFEFIDGAISPYHNPAAAMVIHAIRPEYAMNFSFGTENMYVCSVGTGRIVRHYEPGEIGSISRIGQAIRALQGLLDATTRQQDLVCRVMGKCLYGPPYDREVGDLVSSLAKDDRPDAKFLYTRYDHIYTAEDMQRARTEFRSNDPLALDDLRSMPLMQEVAREYAKVIQPEHFPEAPLHAERLPRY